jgi:hypothetical protein
MDYRVLESQIDLNDREEKAKKLHENYIERN